MTALAQLAVRPPKQPAPLDSLRQNLAVLAQILDARQAVTAVMLPVGTQVLWKIYLVILEDALKTLPALIDYLDQKEKTASIGG
jgi:hypothetical protein